MESRERRDLILKALLEGSKPVKGTEFANTYGVTRQIIVKDIAILRATGKNIIATPDGYIITKEENRKKAILAVCHNGEEMGEELETIVKYGGIIEDVVVEHSVYGEIRGMLMIKNLNDLNKFMDKYKKDKAKPLSALTNGTHIHTISAENEENLTLIKNELRDKGFLVE